MRKALWKTVSTQILKLHSGDTLVFTIGDVKAQLLPTAKDLKDLRNIVLKEIYIPKDVSVVVFPPYVKTSVIRQELKRSKRLVNTYDRIEKGIKSLYNNKEFHRILKETLKKKKLKRS